ncbi:hypothetical protein [Kangiella sediminilitoris]|uniref:Putative conserved secreted protein n=1 Tax=Kangiella sediminilitoris TaxID=1144748 RepID=A0A1B3BA26_9GAMM|nr:hypothetical protein [Kangiella sediminilitoris]AOE49653.1 putative conserved secreted protein [Kangiella sediminilitoris]
MGKFIIVTTLSALALAACSSTPTRSVTNYQAQGNLESPKPSGCVEISKLSNEQNPVDIFTGLNICLSQNNYENAAELYFAGMAYGYFDTKRVSDKTAHQAISVLRMNTFSSQSQESMEKLQSEITNILSSNAELCKKLSSLGAPEYKPTYMLQHGMGAFTGQSTNDDLVESFDAEVTWEESLAKIAKCGQS